MSRLYNGNLIEILPQLAAEPMPATLRIRKTATCHVACTFVDWVAELLAPALAR